ncbi:MAG: hypothetical protein H7308_01280 [Chthonomonadaceae bacterium]|nr:hypothetical protein [Chthonomonadaceae bacterium]
MNLRSFPPPLFSPSEKPLRYGRKGEGRRRLSWSFLGLALGAVFGLLLTSQTRRVMLGEVAILLPPGNPITRLVDSGVPLKSAPDAMELIAQAKKLPTGSFNTKTDAPLFPQETELIALSSRYPDRADVQAGFLRAMTSFRLRVAPVATKHSTTPGKPDNSTPLLAVPPSLVKAMRSAIKNGERVEPDNGYFALESALIELTQPDYEAAFTEVHRAAFCSVWNDHADKESLGEVQSLQRNQGMISPSSRMLLESNQFYSNSFLLSQVASAVRTHAANYELAGNVKAGFDLRINLVSIGIKMANSKDNLAFSLTPKSFLTIGLTKPEGKSRPQKNKTTQQEVKEPIESRVLFYADYLKAKGFSQESRTVKKLLEHPLLTSEYSNAPQGWDGFSDSLTIAALQGAGMLTLAGICVALGFFGCASLFLHRKRFGDYRLPLLTPFLLGGIALGVLLVSLSLMGICLSETPGMMTFLAGALTGFLLFLPRLTRSNANMSQLFQVAGRFMAAGAGVFVLCIGIYVSVSLWTGSGSYASNSVDYEMMDTSQNVTVTVLRIVPLPAIALTTGCILGFFVLLFLFCSIYARTKRQPMASGGLLHFQAMGVPVLALALLGYAGSVIYTAEQIERSKQEIKPFLDQRGQTSVFSQTD